MAKKQFFKPVDPKQDFVAMEKRLLDYWYNKGIVKKYLDRNRNSKKKFSFLDGPITANNPMGVHHAWGRAYKDLWQRFYNMQGYVGRFQNGFDEQGLWVEVEVEKELGFKNKKDIEKFGIDKFVNLCKERVKKFSAIQTEQSKRLGYFMDWDNSYHTSSDENNYAIWNFLKVCHQKGYLYKGRDSVPWCPRCGTAISQHEMLTEEYQEVKHKAVFVKYKIKRPDSHMSKPDQVLKTFLISNDCYLLVWTTTPWTLPSNVAVAVNPDLAYVIVDRIDMEENMTGKFIVAKDGAKYAFKDLEKKDVMLEFKGSQLVAMEYEGIFDELPRLKEVEHRVVAAKDLVTAQEGTGLVHIAPGAGEEDFDIAQKENLAVVESIDESANYIEGFGDLTGQNAKINPDLVINKLKEKDALFKEENYTHRYPTCWRCKTELVWRVVDEWYIAMDRPSSASGRTSDGKSKKTLRQEMVDVAKKINWIPEFGLDRELDWLKNMHDWLISKKRYWGLALPIWECQKCGNFEVIGSKEELKEKSIEGWEKFQGHSPHRPWIDNVKIKCRQCQTVVARIPDVGNPWLDAGIVSISTVPQDWFPADFITESFPGQFKNWFYSLIAMSTVLKNTNPFKTVLGFATLLDEKGEEMHKSKGNAIEFNEAADKIGVDVMRWMYCSQNPVNNLLFGYHRADEVRRRFYLILWNVYSFFVTYANLDSWMPSTGNHHPANILDKWIISRLNNLIDKVTGSLEKYDATASLAIENFVTGDLSTWYIRRSRDRVEEALPTLYIVLVDLAKLIAPFMPFIADEIYMNLTREQSVHLCDLPTTDKKLIDKKLEDQMEQGIALASAIHALRKVKGIKVRQPLPEAIYGQKQLPFEIESVIADEVNVKKVTFKKDAKVQLSTIITPTLRAEGQAREIIRQIQEARKRAGCHLDEKIIVQLPSWPQEFKDYIMRQTLSTKLVKSPNLLIVRSKK